VLQAVHTSLDSLGSRCFHVQRFSLALILLYTAENIVVFTLALQFSIGLMKRTGSRVTVIRGQAETVTLCSDSSHTEVRDCAVHKFSMLNDTFDTLAEYDLVFKDGRPANVIPGTAEPFTVKRYKAVKNVPYSKIKLFLCPRDNSFYGGYKRRSTILKQTIHEQHVR
jgi:hypothetical protein